MKMRAGLLLMIAVALAGALAVIQSADAHYSVPRYNGNDWGQRCLTPTPRGTPVGCCNFARSNCMAACELADADAGWKNACRANCQAAGQACLARVTPRPPVGDVPGTRPPATRD